MCYLNSRCDPGVCSPSVITTLPYRSVDTTPSFGPSTSPRPNAARTPRTSTAQTQPNAPRCPALRAPRCREKTGRLDTPGSQAGQGLAFPHCSQGGTYIPEVLRCWTLRQTRPVLMFPKAPRARVMGVGSRKGGLFFWALKMDSVKSHSKPHSTAHYREQDPCHPGDILNV